MTTTTLADLRTVLRRHLCDVAAATFANAELDVLIRDAIRAFSYYVPQEVRTTLAVTDGVEWYNTPDDCFGIISVTGYTVAESFASQFRLDPVPTVSESVEIKYKTVHDLPISDSDVSTYDLLDQPTIIKHARANAWSTLAGDSARQAHWREGDIEEWGSDGAKIGSESDRLMSEFEAEAEKARTRTQAIRSTTHPVKCGVVSRKSATTSTTIWKGWLA